MLLAQLKDMLEEFSQQTPSSLQNECLKYINQCHEAVSLLEGDTMYDFTIEQRAILREHMSNHFDKMQAAAKELMMPINELVSLLDSWGNFKIESLTTQLPPTSEIHKVDENGCMAAGNIKTWVCPDAYLQAPSPLMTKLKKALAWVKDKLPRKHEM